MAKVHISTLSNDELQLLIAKTVIKRGLAKIKVKLLLETYSLSFLIDKGWLDDDTQEARGIIIRNISHVTGEYVIKPVEGK